MTPALTGNLPGSGTPAEPGPRDQADGGSSDRSEIPYTLIDQARSGNQAACRKLIEALQRPIFATIYRFLGRGFSSDVEDIAQDVLVKIFRSLDRFDPTRGVQFTTWAYAVVRNHCLDVRKKKSCVRLSLSSREDDEGQIEVPDPGLTPEDRVLDAELGRQVERALDALDDDQRQTFILKEYQGLDCEQIAQVMGTATGTVKSRLFRARAILRRHLAPYLEAGC